MEDSKSRFVLTFSLKTEKWQEDIIDKRLEASRRIYNMLVNKVFKILKELKKSKVYRELVSELDDVSIKDKSQVWIKINKIRDSVGLSEYGLKKLVNQFRLKYKNLVHSHIAQRLASRLWMSLTKFFYLEGKKIHYCKYGQMNSLEGQENKSGIMFKLDGMFCFWQGIKIPIKIDKRNVYEVSNIQSKVAFCRIIRKFVRSKKKYYIQIIFKGIPYCKNRHRKLGKGDVGIDIGTSTIAYSSENEVFIGELAEKSQKYQFSQVLLLRALDRSRRSTNPQNYDEKGIILKGSKHWNKSKHYLKTLLELKEVCRKQKEVRRYQHEILSNHIITLGDTFYVEDINFEALKRKSKKLEKDDNGKFKKRKRFGKSISNRAPALLIEMISYKLNFLGTNLIRINTFLTKASQYNHITDTYEKKTLSQRWNTIDNKRVQRDLYSSFLIMNTNSELTGFDRDKCFNRFSKFIKLHDIEVNRLKGKKNLQSIGI